jgi:succinoglycan biosynthesis protein ExoL
LSKVKLPVRIIENKVLKTDDNVADQPRRAVRPDGPPWVVGWFGNVRCRKSLDILIHLVQQSEGAVQAVIRGKPAFNEFEDFHKQTSGTPGMRFLGPYKNPEDLASIHQSVHFYVGHRYV